MSHFVPSQATRSLPPPPNLTQPACLEEKNSPWAPSERCPALLHCRRPRHAGIYTLQIAAATRARGSGVIGPSIPV